MLQASPTTWCCLFTDALECAVVVLGVKIFTQFLRIAASDDPPGTTTTRSGCCHSELVIIPALLPGQNPFVITKNNTVLDIRIGPALLDQAQRLPHFCRQVTERHFTNRGSSIRPRFRPYRTREEQDYEKKPVLFRKNSQEQARILCCTSINFSQYHCVE